MSRRSGHYTRVDLQDIHLNGSSHTTPASSSNNIPSTPAYHSPLPRSRRSLLLIISAGLLLSLITLFHRSGIPTKETFIQSTFNRVDLKKWSKVSKDGSSLSRVFGSPVLDDKRITLIAMW